MLVDYTHASVVGSNVRAAIERGVGVIVGSSGLTAAEYAEIDALARTKQVGVIAAGNFSLGAALLLRFAVEAARHIEAWEVIDYASAGKPDAPSGTSRELAERLEEVRRPALGVALDRDPRRDRGAGRDGGGHAGALRAAAELRRLDGGRLRGAGRTAHAAPRRGETPEPYVAGTLLAIRALPGRVGVTRGLDQL